MPSIIVCGKEAQTKIFQIKIGCVVTLHKQWLLGGCAVSELQGRECCGLKYTIVGTATHPDRDKED